MYVVVVVCMSCTVCLSVGTKDAKSQDPIVPNASKYLNPTSVARPHPVTGNVFVGRQFQCSKDSLYSVALFPGLPCFSSSVFVQYNTRKRKSATRALPLPCIILNENRRTKTGEAWERGYKLPTRMALCMNEVAMGTMGAQGI